MTPAKKILFRVGIGCLAIFVLLAIIGNPFESDICASKGYGYPFPVYISWCECFSEGYPPSVYFSYVVSDLLFWGIIWLIFSLLFMRFTTRSYQSA
jgi:hypothetical protein